MTVNLAISNYCSVYACERILLTLSIFDDVLFLIDKVPQDTSQLWMNEWKNAFNYDQMLTNYAPLVRHLEHSTFRFPLVA
jgi:hypothetical protein